MGIKKRLIRKAAVPLIATGISVFMLATTISSVVGMIGGTIASQSCSTLSTEPNLSDGTIKPNFVTSDQLTNAKKIAAVLEAYGLDKNKVYGAIGNGEKESSLIAPFIELNFLWSYWKDANSVESAVEAIQKHGSKAEGLFKHGWGSVLAAYGGQGLSEEGYKGGSPDGSHWVGFGIWQWTGYNGVMPYFDWADANKLPRASIDSMLAFAVSDSSQFFQPYTAEGDFYYKRLEKIKAMPSANSPAEGATIWLNNYEYAGSAPSGGWVHLEQRQQYATNWAVRLEKEKLDEDYGRSILSLGNSSSAQSNAEKNKDICGNDSSKGMSKGGHPYAKDYYLTAAFRSYNKARSFGAANSGNNWHNGIDLVAEWSKGFGVKDNNKEIFSVYNGTVVSKSPSFGQILVKSDPSDTKLDKPVILEYTHLQTEGNYNKWKVGDKVMAGQQLGIEGDSGSPGLNHLHFGVLNSEAFSKGYDLWNSGTQINSNYGNTVDDIIIDPGLVLGGIEPGWLDTGSNNYLGDEFLQPNPLKIRVDGTTKDDPRMKGKK